MVMVTHDLDTFVCPGYTRVAVLADKRVIVHRHAAKSGGLSERPSSAIFPGRRGLPRHGPALHRQGTADGKQVPRLAAGLFVLVVTALVVAWASGSRATGATTRPTNSPAAKASLACSPRRPCATRGCWWARHAHRLDSQTSGNVLIRIAVSVDAPSPHHLCRAGLPGRDRSGLRAAGRRGRALPCHPPGPSGLLRLPLRTSPFTQLFDQGPAILCRVQEATERIKPLLSDDNQRLLRELLANTRPGCRRRYSLSQRLGATAQQRLDPALAALPPLGARGRRRAAVHAPGGRAGVGMAVRDPGRPPSINAPRRTLEQTERGAQALAQAVSVWHHHPAAHGTRCRRNRLRARPGRAAPPQPERETHRASSTVRRGQPGPGNRLQRSPQRTGVQTMNTLKIIATGACGGRYGRFVFVFGGCSALPEPRCGRCCTTLAPRLCPEASGNAAAAHPVRGPDTLDNASQP